MPKEVVYGEKPFDGQWQKSPDDELVEVIVPIESVVEVRWDRHGYFQIATRWVTSTSGGDVQEYPAEMKSIYGEQTEEDRVAFLARSEGIYVHLDRDGINSLIRDLRRARDQTYGKDE